VRKGLLAVGAVLVLGALVLGLAALSGSRRGAGPAPTSPPLTVAAAADLHDAFGEIGEAWFREDGSRVVFSFGASGDLVRQIEQGAPFDVLAAANSEFVEALARRNRVLPDTQAVYALGRLALVRPPGSPRPSTDLRQLCASDFQRIAIANPAHAPYGRAAREALIRAGLWDLLQSRLVLAPNVRQALQYVESGNADAGLVARASAVRSELPWSEPPATLYGPLRQTLAVVAGGPQEARARRFARLVTGPQGQAILQKHGFDLPGDE